MGFDWPTAIIVGIAIAVFVYVRSVRAEKRRDSEKDQDT